MKTIQQVKDEETEFKKLFIDLLSLYPAPDVKKSEAGPYWHYLQDIPFVFVSRAMYKAPTRSPKNFPAAGLLRTIALSIAKDSRNTETPKNISVSNDIKPNPDDPYQKLAEKWKKEGARLGIRPDDHTPRDICQRRFGELGNLLEQSWLGNPLQNSSSILTEEK